jgi:hypothetical protein
MIFLFSYCNDLEQLKDMPRERLAREHVDFYYEVWQHHARLIKSCVLAPPDQARTVYPRDGEMLVRNGPNEELALPVSGFHFVEADSMEEVVEVAKRYPLPEGFGTLEIRPVGNLWEETPELDTDAPPEAVWRLYGDVSTWPRWRAGVEQVELDRDFGAGASGTLTTKERGTLPFRITGAKHGSWFAMEIDYSPEITMKVGHELIPLPQGGTRIRHIATIPRATLDLLGMEFRLAHNDETRASLHGLAAEATGTHQS